VGICQLVILEHRKKGFIFVHLSLIMKGKMRNLPDGYLLVMGDYFVMNFFCCGKWQVNERVINVNSDSQGYLVYSEFLGCFCYSLLAL